MLVRHRQLGALARLEANRHVLSNRHLAGGELDRWDDSQDRDDQARATVRNQS